MERIFGPVITAIDAGHVEHGGSCVRCTRERSARVGVEEKAEFPCEAILAARVRQRVYAQRIRQERAIAAGMLSSLATR